MRSYRSRSNREIRMLSSPSVEQLVAGTSTTRWRICRNSLLAAHEIREAGVHSQIHLGETAVDSLEPLVHGVGTDFEPALQLVQTLICTGKPGLNFAAKLSDLRLKPVGLQLVRSDSILNVG
jgi:hypothetical protein